MTLELALLMSCFHSWEWPQIVLLMSVYLAFYKQVEHVGSLSLNLRQENLQHHESEKFFCLITKTPKALKTICLY